MVVLVVVLLLAVAAVVVSRGCKLVSHFEEERLQKTSLNAN